MVIAGQPTAGIASCEMVIFLVFINVFNDTGALDNLLYPKHHWQYSYRHADVFQHEDRQKT